VVGHHLVVAETAESLSVARRTWGTAKSCRRSAALAASDLCTAAVRRVADETLEEDEAGQTASVSNGAQRSAESDRIERWPVLAQSREVDKLVSGY